VIRREALKKMTLAMGGALSATTISAVLTHCSSKNSFPLSGELKFFTEDQFQVISVIADRIVPATDTAGAIEVGCPAFVDLMLFDCYEKDNQDKFINGLNVFQSEIDSETGSDALSLKSDKLEAFLTDYEIKIDSADNRKDEEFFLRTLKELTLLGYFTSKEGATMALRYVPVPGKYEACKEMEDERAWAL